MKFFLLIITFFAINPLIGFSQTDSLKLSDEEQIVDLLKFDKYSYNLGNVVEGDVLFFNIAFTNVSKDTVEIDFISSCECTEVEYPLSMILPGESGILKVKFDSKGKTESETTDIDVFLKNRDESGSQIYYTLEYSFKLVK